MATPIVTFRTLAEDNTVVALCGSHDTMSVNVDKVIEYMSKMKELTGGVEVEFNNTFRQMCKDRVFFAFEPIDFEKFTTSPYVPAVVECVLLSDDRVAMNINGTIHVMYPEEGNLMFKTKSDAEDAAKQNALDNASKYLNMLFGGRKEIKDALKNLNALIDNMLNFKKSI